MNKLNTSVMIFFSPRLFKTIKNTISLYKTLLFIKSVFEIHNQWSRAGNVWSSRAEPLWFLRRPRDRGIRRWLKSLFYSAREASCGRYNTGTSFFSFLSFCVSTRWHEHDKTNHYVPIPESIIQSFLCPFAFHVVFSSFSVSEHHSSPQVCPGPMLPWWSSALG